MTYTENGLKNHSGAIHQVHLNNKIVKHYANKSLGCRYFVHLTKLHISKLRPQVGGKGCKPVKVRLLLGNLGIMTCHWQTKLESMYASAGLNHENISNHSLPATGVTSVPEKIILKRSGHLSVSGFWSYECTTSLQHKEVSDLPRCVSKTEMEAFFFAPQKENHTSLIAHTRQSPSLYFIFN